MSVIKSKRSVSPVEFIHTARELEIYTIRKVVNFPKRYTFYVSQPLAESATRVHKLVKAGNSIYPTNKHEAQLRRDYFLKALAELQSLVSQIEIANELFSVEANSMKMWGELINKEDRLLRAVLKKEQQRYKNLP